MKIQTALFAVVFLAGCSQSPSSVENPKPASAEDMKMTDTEHKNMSEGANQMPTDAAAASTTASASGTVEAIDTTAGKITIAHGPVEALKWPAMTMSFKATAEQMASVQAGEKVDFEFVSNNMDASLTRIAPSK